ncbi:hypothetical protein [Salipaludibacillus daqingensis]|uniref:hypothetical protein n=1 Tax=Salipaludibacillus daqingensis TaxID=3041001 RepID=UPI002472FA00|nr:hypothetical protein [Salipaludibacillus daqingensis]
MKKVIIFIIIMLAISYGGYRILLTYASDQLIDQVKSEVLDEETLDALMKDSDVASMIDNYRGDLPISQGSSIPKEDLPFTTKEDATKLLVSKFSLGEIRDITSKASRGLTLEEQVELEKKVLERLTPEEIEALLVVGLSEIAFE